jgi:hypothetical protein
MLPFKLRTKDCEGKSFFPEAFLRFGDQNYRHYLKAFFSVASKTLERTWAPLSLAV